MSDVKECDADPVSLLGVTLTFLLHFIDVECEGRNKLMGMTTSNVNDRYVKKLTSKTQLSLCEQMQKEGQLDNVGRASWFISHAWQYQFLDTVDAILSFFRAKATQEHIGETEMMSTIIWFDLFSNSQHNTCEKPFEWWKGTFTSAIKTMGNMLQVLTPWDDPLPFKRAWCVFEIYACESSDSQYNITMTDAESQRFLEMILKDPREFHDMLARVDTSKSVSSFVEDKERIHNAINRLLPEGFTQLNSMVLRVVERWMISVIDYKLANVKSTVGVVNEEVKWMNAKAILFEKQGKYAEAEPLYKACLKTRISDLGESNPDTLDSIHNLGRLYINKGEYAKAEPLYLKCFEKRRNVLGDCDVKTLSSLNNLAVLYEYQGKYAEAEQLYLECLKTRKRVFGDSHRDTLASLNNLAVLYFIQGKYAEAEPLYEECLKKSECVRKHPDTLTAMSNLAVLYYSQDKNDEAEQLHVECLEKRKSMLGKMHPDTLASIDNLFVLYESKCKSTEAELLDDNCVQEESKSELNDISSEILTSIDNLAELCETKLKLTEVEP